MCHGTRPITLSHIMIMNWFTFSSTQSSYTNAEEEMYTKMKIGFPFMRTAKLELGAGVGITTFNYKGTYTPTTPDHYDESDQKLFVVTALLDKSSYTVKQFPVTGSATRIAFNYITGDCRNGAYGLDSLNEVHKNYTKYMATKAGFKPQQMQNDSLDCQDILQLALL